MHMICHLAEAQGVPAPSVELVPEAKWIRELPQEVKDPLVPQLQGRPRMGCLRGTGERDEKVLCNHYPWRAEENFDVQILLGLVG